jgi:hypothetical protein
VRGWEALMPDMRSVLKLDYVDGVSITLPFVDKLGDGQAAETIALLVAEGRKWRPRPVAVMGKDDSAAFIEVRGLRLAQVYTEPKED